MFQYYLEVLRWLHFEAPIQNFVDVPQIESHASLDATTANKFKRFVEAYQRELRSNPQCLAIEASQAVFKQRVSKSAARQAEKLELDARDSLIKLAGEATSAFQKLAVDERKILDDHLLEIKKQVDTTSDTVNEIVNEATSKIQAARSLKDWGEAYDKTIAEYRLRLSGKRLPHNVMSRNWHSLAKLISMAWTQPRHPLLKIVLLLGELFWVVIRNTANCLSLLTSKLRSYSGQRTIWFTLLIAFTIIAVGLSILPLTSESQWLGLDIMTLKAQPWLKLTILVPVAVILGLAYSFAIKNYRIYSNMLDQYEHRRTVAYTAQGIILSLKDTGDTDLREQVTAAASTALFDHKNTGHLTKSESESLNVLGLIKNIRSQ